MKGLSWMYSFRIFIFIFVLVYILLNITDKILIGFVILAIGFLFFYYFKYIINIFKSFGYYWLVILLAIIVAFFVYARNKIKETQIDLDQIYNLKIVAIRDTIGNDILGMTLGKIISDDKMNNKLVLISSNLLEEYRIGQVLNINSKINKNKYLSNLFDMMFFGKVDYQINFPEIRVVKNISGGYFFRGITWIRNIIDKKIKSIFGLKHYSLFSMWMLGKTKTSDQALNNIFKSLGVSHILVVSGTHLTILFNLVYYLILFLPLSYLGTILLAIIFLILFLFLSGFSSSILRATMFWIIMTVGKLNGKIINYTNILLIILLGFLILNPLVILYDIGFHLSFLSIVALVYITPMFNQYFKSRNQYMTNILVVFNASLAVIILLVPYLVYIFKEFNVMSLIFNIFLIPFSGLLLGMVFLVVLIGIIWISIANILGLIVNYLSNIFLWSLNMLNNFSVRLNFMMFNSIFFVIIYYVVLTIIVIDFYIRHKELTLNL